MEKVAPTGSDKTNGSSRPATSAGSIRSSRRDFPCVSVRFKKIAVGYCFLPLSSMMPRFRVRSLSSALRNSTLNFGVFTCTFFAWSRLILICNPLTTSPQVRALAFHATDETSRNAKPASRTTHRAWRTIFGKLHPRLLSDSYLDANPLELVFLSHFVTERPAQGVTYEIQKRTH
jgi:hypothetical protein